MPCTFLDIALYTAQMASIGFFPYLYAYSRGSISECFIGFCLVFQRVKDIFLHLSFVEMAIPVFHLIGTTGIWTRYGS
jgi:hypothetical protein